MAKPQREDQESEAFWASRFSELHDGIEMGASPLDKSAVESMVAKLKSSSSFADRLAFASRVVRARPESKHLPAALALCQSMQDLLKKSEIPERMIALDVMGALFEARHIKDAQRAADLMGQILRSCIGSTSDMVRIAAWFSIRDIVASVGMAAFEGTSASQLWPDLIKALKTALQDKSVSVAAAAVNACLALAPVVTMDAASGPQAQALLKNDGNASAVPAHGGSSGGSGNSHPLDAAITLFNLLGRDLALVGANVSASNITHGTAPTSLTLSPVAYMEWRGASMRLTAPAWGGIGAAYGALLGFALRVPAPLLSPLPSGGGGGGSASGSIPASDIGQALGHLAQLFAKSNKVESRVAIIRALAALLDTLAFSALEQSLPDIAWNLFSLLSTHANHKDVYGAATGTGTSGWSHRIFSSSSSPSSSRSAAHLASMFMGMLGAGLPTSELGNAVLDETMSAVSFIWRNHVIARLPEVGKLSALHALVRLLDSRELHAPQAPHQSHLASAILIELRYVCENLGQVIFSSTEVDWISLVLHLLPVPPSNVAATSDKLQQGRGSRDNRDADGATDVEPLPMAIVFALGNLVLTLAALHDRFTLYGRLLERVHAWCGAGKDSNYMDGGRGTAGVSTTSINLPTNLALASQYHALQASFLVACSLPAASPSLAPRFVDLVMPLVTTFICGKGGVDGNGESLPLPLLRTAGWFLACSVLRGLSFLSAAAAATTTTKTLASHRRHNDNSDGDMGNFLLDETSQMVDTIGKCLRVEFTAGVKNNTGASVDEATIAEYLLPKTVAVATANLLADHSASALLSLAAGATNNNSTGGSREEHAEVATAALATAAAAVQHAATMLGFAVGSLGAVLKVVSQWLAPTQGAPLRINDATTEQFADGFLVVLFDAYATLVRAYRTLMDRAVVEHLRQGLSVSVELPSIPMRTLLNLVSRQLMRGRAMSVRDTHQWLQWDADSAWLDDETHPAANANATVAALQAAQGATHHRNQRHLDYVLGTQLTPTLLRVCAATTQRHTNASHPFSSATAAGAATATTTTTSGSAATAPTAGGSSGVFFLSQASSTHRSSLCVLPSALLLQLSFDLFAGLFLAQPSENQLQLLRFFTDNINAPPPTAEARHTLQTNLLASLCATALEHRGLFSASTSGSAGAAAAVGRTGGLGTVPAQQQQRLSSSLSAPISNAVSQVIMTIVTPYTVSTTGLHRRLAADTLALLADTEEAIHATGVKTLFATLRTLVSPAGDGDDSRAAASLPKPDDFTLIGTAYALGRIAQRVGGIRSRQYSGEVIKLLLSALRLVHGGLTDMFKSDGKLKSLKDLPPHVVHLLLHIKWLLCTAWQLLDTTGSSLSVAALGNQTLTLLHQLISRGHVMWLADATHFVGLTTSAVVQLFGPELQFDPRLLRRLVSVLHVLETHLGLGVSPSAPARAPASSLLTPSASAPAPVTLAQYRAWAINTPGISVLAGAALWSDAATTLVRERLLLFAPSLVLGTGDSNPSQSTYASPAVGGRTAPPLLHTQFVGAFLVTAVARHGHMLHSAAPLRVKSLQALRLVVQLSPAALGLADLVAEGMATSTTITTPSPSPSPSELVLFLLHEYDQEPLSAVRQEFGRLLVALDDLLTARTATLSASASSSSPVAVQHTSTLWLHYARSVVLGGVSLGPADPRVFLPVTAPPQLPTKAGGAAASSSNRSPGLPMSGDNNENYGDVDEEEEGMSGIMGGGRKFGFGERNGGDGGGLGGVTMNTTTSSGSSGGGSGRTGTATSVSAAAAVIQWSCSTTLVALLLSRVAVCLQRIQRPLQQHQQQRRQRNSTSSGGVAAALLNEDELHTNMRKAQASAPLANGAPYAVLLLEDIVSMAFKGCGSADFEGQREGVYIIIALLDLFEHVPDPDMQRENNGEADDDGSDGQDATASTSTTTAVPPPRRLLLELHRAQIGSALRQAIQSFSAADDSAAGGGASSLGLGCPSQDRIASYAFAALARVITWIAERAAASNPIASDGQSIYVASSALRNLINPLLGAARTTLPSTSPAHRAWLAAMAHLWSWSRSNNSNGIDMATTTTASSSKGFPTLLQPFLPSTGGTPTGASGDDTEALLLYAQLVAGWISLLDGCRTSLHTHGIDIRLATTAELSRTFLSPHLELAETKRVSDNDNNDDLYDSLQYITVTVDWADAQHGSPSSSQIDHDTLHWRWQKYLARRVTLDRATFGFGACCSTTTTSENHLSSPPPLPLSSPSALTAGSLVGGTDVAVSAAGGWHWYHVLHAASTATTTGGGAGAADSPPDPGRKIKVDRALLEPLAFYLADELDALFANPNPTTESGAAAAAPRAAAVVLLASSATPIAFAPPLSSELCHCLDAIYSALRAIAPPAPPVRQEPGDAEVDDMSSSSSSAPEEVGHHHALLPPEWTHALAACVAAVRLVLLPLAANTPPPPPLRHLTQPTTSSSPSSSPDWWWLYHGTPLRVLITTCESASRALSALDWQSMSTQDKDVAGQLLWDILSMLRSTMAMVRSSGSGSGSGNQQGHHHYHEVPASAVLHGVRLLLQPLRMCLASHNLASFVAWACVSCAFEIIGIAFTAPQATRLLALQELQHCLALLALPAPSASDVSLPSDNGGGGGSFDLLPAALLDNALQNLAVFISGDGDARSRAIRNEHLALLSASYFDSVLGLVRQYPTLLQGLLAKFHRVLRGGASTASSSRAPALQASVERAGLVLAGALSSLKVFVVLLLSNQPQPQPPSCPTTAVALGILPVTIDWLSSASPTCPPPTILSVAVACAGLIVATRASTVCTHAVSAFACVLVMLWRQDSSTFHSTVGLLLHLAQHSPDALKYAVASLPLDKRAQFEEACRSTLRAAGQIGQERAENAKPQLKLDVTKFS